MNLKNLQSDFLQSISSDLIKTPSYIASADACGRMEVYKDSARSVLQLTICEIFPGVKNLIGESCLKSIANHFISEASNLPKSGCLDDWGAGFPEFIKQYEKKWDLPYLADYAQYEWNNHFCSLKPDQKPKSFLSDFEGLLEEECSNIRFKFVPSMILSSYAWPVEQIDKFATSNDQEEIKILPKNSYIVFVKNSSAPTTINLTAGLYVFINSLLSGVNLLTAYQNASLENTNFDLKKGVELIYRECLVLNHEL